MERSLSGARFARLSWFLWLSACVADVGAPTSFDETQTAEPEEVHCALTDLAEDEGLPLHRKAISVPEDRVARIADTVAMDSRGLPLWESRPGAKVALYLDFDGGYYVGRDYYRGIDLDGNRARFSRQERRAIIRAALEVAKGYEGFDVNVTTSDAARTNAAMWGWILITDDESTSGKARVGVIGRRSDPQGIAGSKAVFSPPSAQRGYLLIHELGHEFGLHHSGLYKNGRFFEWSELKQSRTSDWMGGRSSYFSHYTWLRSQTERSRAWQDPVEIIGGIAGSAPVNGPAPGDDDCHSGAPGSRDYCSRACPCREGEGDCDNNQQCEGDLICAQQDGTDYCARLRDHSCDATVRNKSNGGSGYGECEGDCDRDADCQPGLVCVQVDTGDAVPGCRGRSRSNYDYCAYPTCM